MAEEDLMKHALNSDFDYYDLLDLDSAANETEIRRAYRLASFKYHPDKVGPDDKDAAEKLHLVQIANRVLLDSTARQVYDNGRLAKEQKKASEAAYSDRRRQQVEDLERRERAGREDAQKEEAHQRELKRLAADTARRREELREQRRKEAEEDFDRENQRHVAKDESMPTAAADVLEIDRTVRLQYVTNAPDKAQLGAQLTRFGEIQSVALLNKRIKVAGQKHRQDGGVAMVVFASISGAHAAVTDIPRLANSHGEWSMFKSVTWASGKEPDFIPKSKAPTSGSSSQGSEMKPTTPVIKPTTMNSSSSDMDLLLIRCKIAEQRRREALGITSDVIDSRKDSGEDSRRAVPSFPSFKRAREKHTRSGRTQPLVY